MSDLFNGRSAPVHIAPMKPMARQDGSFKGPATPGMQPYSDPLPVETPTRAAPVTFSAPITRTPSPRVTRHLVGPLVGVKPLVDENYSRDGHATILPPEIAGQAEGEAVTAISNRKSVDPRFAAERLFMPLSDRGR
jgi:hypothetical protein